MTLTRQEQKIQTREKLIRVSTEVFSKKGIFSTKTLDVAKASKVSHGTVFSHFSTKEELLIAVIDEVGRKISNEF